MRICLSIGAATTEEVRCIWKKWAEIVDIVEIRLDTMQDRSLTSLLLHRPGPVIVTNRRADEGGDSRVTSGNGYTFSLPLRSRGLTTLTWKRRPLYPSSQRL